MKLKNFASDYIRLNDNKKTYRKVKHQILTRLIIPRFGDSDMERITVLDVDMWIADMRDGGLSNKTINNYTSVLRNLLNKAAKYGYLKKTPRVERQRPKEVIMEFLSPDQAQQLVATMPEGVWRSMAIVALNTGLRIGELRALKWKRVDMNRATLTVAEAFCGRNMILDVPKGHKSREIPLNRLAIDALKNLDRSNEFVFSIPKSRFDTKSALSYKACDFRMRSVRARLRLPWVTWHTLRHSFASHLAMSGSVTILQIKELLGHVDISVTMKYAKLMPSTLVVAVAALESRKK